ncbi:MAG: sigma 54-interacting transcriptional regulator [Myxococcales bacterium]|nr:sigma 54-interacting transcriptional regulator [Polyangiaceae bacterium]MDW8248127.1 sigma 54-interacting transcriptional regulator [Myxococcales bacterium]
MSSPLADPEGFSGLVLAAEGASALVFRGRDQEGREVACKVARAPRFWPTVEREAERLSWLETPGIPELCGAGRWREGELRGAPFLVLPWVDGCSLREHMTAGSSSRLAPVVALWVGGALASLEQAGLSHGDVKPENLRVDWGQQRAWLLDLGLGGEASKGQIEGGSLRYLAPEARRGEIVERRLLDRYALGAVLQELGAEGALGQIAEALVSPAPRARPSPSLLLGVCMGSPEAFGAFQAARVRDAYLRVRRAELEQAARSTRVQVSGAAVRWLGERLRRLRAARALVGLPEGPPMVLDPLDVRGRQRWLCSLVGPAAASWPVGRLGEEAALGAALEALAREAPVHGWTFERVAAALGGLPGARRPEPEGDLELALALARPHPPDEALQAGERRVRQPGAPEPLVVAMIEALRRRGQPERALMVARSHPGFSVALACAEAARRVKDPEGARELLRRAREGNGEAGKVLEARLLFDEGRYGDALALLGGPGEDAATAEVESLCLTALGRPAEGREAAERGKALAEGEEAQARLAAALGYAAHAQGDTRTALAAYREAVQIAARAGAAVEEATYRTGEVACAVDAGDLEGGIEAAQRATALWEALGRPGDSARALLGHAAALRVVGATLEALRVAEEARCCAEEAGDRRAQGYAWLVAWDAGAGTAALEEAWGLLRGDPGDELRWAARALEAGLLRGDPPDPRQGTAAAQLEWWGAWARALSRGAAGRADETLARLVELTEGPGPVALRGEAAHAGRRLALERGDGAAARRLGVIQRECAERALAGCPAGYRASLLGQPWVQEVRLVAEGSGGERIEAALHLVRALSGRDQLRPLLEQIVDALISWTGVERGLLLMPAPGGKLVPRVARNLDRRQLPPSQLALSRTLAQRALAERRPVVAVDAAGESGDTLASVHALQLRSVLAVPLLARGEVLGVVYLDDRIRRGAFGPDEVAWVDLVAGVAAVALADARDQVLLRRAVRKAKRAEEALAWDLARREAELSALERQIRDAPVRRGLRFAYDEIVGSSEALEQALRVVDRVAPTEIPVLITGETGVGKELFARAIHRYGPRSGKRFLSENCGAIPPTLLETTLFGHAKGAFTGADRAHVGLFELADGGTLFLDEIGEMPLPMQVKLLRVLQEGEVRPVGSNTSRKVNVRILTATHRDLGKMVAEGTFREDLYFRLRVIELRVPPLRERPGDIPLLIQHLLAKHGEGRKIKISPRALELLCAHPWPGNIRQLENTLRAALVLSDGVIEPQHLGLDKVPQESSSAGGLMLRERVDALEGELIREALRQTRGNQSKAAELLGVSRFGLQKMMKRLQIVT